MDTVPHDLYTSSLAHIHSFIVRRYKSMQKHMDEDTQYALKAALDEIGTVLIDE